MTKILSPQAGGAQLRQQARGVAQRRITRRRHTAPRQPRRVGYGRVSTQHQTEDQQQAQLQAAGCDAVHTETISSGKRERPVLAQVLAELQPGDTLTICKLDRLARSLQELLTITADLEARGVNLQVLDQSIDTGTPTGRLLFQMLGAVAEFERCMAIERTRASIAHRRATGGDLGGRKASWNRHQHRRGLELQQEGLSVRQIAEQLNLSRAATGRMLKLPLLPELEPTDG